jgi:hypothetical protein
MFSIRGSAKRRPTLRDAADQLHVPVDQLDSAYGVQVIDPGPTSM